MYIRSLKECYDQNYNMPGSDDPHGFELLVRDCAAIKFRQDFHLYGRSGQAQHGIDIFSDDWTILIQCKAYSETPDSYKKFQEDIKAEFTKAKTHFQRKGKLFFRRFILATTLKGDSSTQDIARDIPVKEIDEELGELGPNLNVTVWFRDTLLKIINDCRIHNDGDSYAEGFEETLFLHKNRSGCENVNLKNLFVFQEYRELIPGNSFGKPLDNLEDRLRCFCGGQHKMLIIEGDAGSGKSTLAAKLCFEERKRSRQIVETVPEVGSPLPISPGLLVGRPLLTVRLRDLEITGNPEYQLGQSILSRFKKNLEKKELEKLFPHAVFLLDGFDELCMMLKGLCDRENMLVQLCSWLPRDCKIILTSRPKYIHLERLSTAFSFSLISLQHFSPGKRKKWLNRYRELFPEDRGAVDEEVAQYILSMGKNSVSNLCDTPMALYLLIGSRANFELTKNEWALYRYIFADAVVNTPYAGQLGGASHPMGPNIGRLLYRITEEIAFKMYCSGEAPEDQSTIQTADGKFLVIGEIASRIMGELLKDGQFNNAAESPEDQSIIQTEDGKFLVTGETVARIIEELLKDGQFNNAAVQAGLRDAKSFDLQRIHALCGYWRSGTANGPVEFYHNNIRDFFLCEKIRREFNHLYQEGRSDEEKTDRIAQRLVNLFKYGVINETVCRFLGAYARKAASKQEQIELPLLEKERHLLPILFQKLLTQGRLYDNLGMNDHIDAIRSILLSIGLVYKHVYEPILEVGERIRWWNDVDAVKRSSMLQFILKNCVGKFASRSDLRGTDLSRANLREADMQGTDLSESVLRGADLSRANLSEAVLCGTVLNGAVLSKANLREAKLCKADLNRADLSGTDLRGAVLSGVVSYRADLSGAVLNGANLCGAVLCGADLRGAVLNGADLREAVLSGVDLRGATLPDGYRSANQDEQIEHLKWLNIHNLKL